MENCDLFVIGGGSGGVRAARIAGKLGAKVILAEKNKLGGTCVNVGCVPKKIFSYAAKFNDEFALAKKYGWDLNVKSFNWQEFIKNKDTEISRLGSIYGSVLEKSNVSIIFGQANILADRKIAVDGKIYNPKNILIAVGGVPQKLDIKGGELSIVSDDIFYLAKIPKSMLVVGAGYIGLEMASIFNSFGTDCKVTTRSGKILKDFDSEIADLLKEQMTKNGVEFIANNLPEKLEKADEQIKVTFQDGKTAKFDQVLSAIGRKPNFDGLGLENLKLNYDKKGKIAVTNYFDTGLDGVYAVGDISSSFELTPVAIREGMILSKQLFNGIKAEFNYGYVPTAVFSNPNLATVGLSEDAAKTKGIEYKLYKSKFKPMRTGFAGDDKQFFIKIIAEAKSEKILGIHLLGEDSPEMIQGFALAMSLGCTKHDLEKLVGIHPTTAEEIITI